MGRNHAEATWTLHNELLKKIQFTCTHFACMLYTTFTVFIATTQIHIHPHLKQGCMHATTNMAIFLPFRHLLCHLVGES